VRVSRTAQAETDAFEIALTISEDSLDAALRFLDNLEGTVRQLERFPLAGSRVALKRFPNLHCIAVPQFPKHRLFYTVDEDAVTVVRAGNTRREWSELLGGVDPLP
jgi:plasmid stabilization system protein ParE